VNDQGGGSGAVTDAELLREVQAVVQKVLRTAVPDARADLIEDGLIDSLAFIDLLYALEGAFGLQIPIERISFDDFRTVTAMAAMVDRERKSPHTAGGNDPT
jgi:acyl carrier protein